MTKFSGFVFIPFWNWVARLWGKRKAYGLSLVGSVIGFTLMAIPRKGDLVLAIAVTAFAGMSGIFLTTYNFLYQVLFFSSNLFCFLVTIL